jgi:hypothetical protein
LARNNQGEACSYIIKLSSKARQEWEAFASHIETELGKGGQLELASDWAGKLSGLAGRLAGQFHVMEYLDHAPLSYVLRI